MISWLNESLALCTASSMIVNAKENKTTKSLRAASANQSSVLWNFVTAIIHCSIWIWLNDDSTMQQT